MEDKEQGAPEGSGGKSNTMRRPMNAFLIFCKRHRTLVREKNPHLDNRSVTRILGELWANLAADEKASYIDLAKQYKEAFLKANPNYRWYNPSRNQGNGSTTPNPLPPTPNAGMLLYGCPQVSITPGKLADPSDMGGLSLLLMAGQQSMDSASKLSEAPPPPQPPPVSSISAAPTPPAAATDRTAYGATQLPQPGSGANRDKTTALLQLAEMCTTKWDHWPPPDSKPGFTQAGSFPTSTSLTPSSAPHLAKQSMTKCEVVCGDLGPSPMVPPVGGLPITPPWSPTYSQVSPRRDTLVAATETSRPLDLTSLIQKHTSLAGAQPPVDVVSKMNSRTAKSPIDGQFTDLKIPKVSHDQGEFGKLPQKVDKKPTLNVRDSITHMMERKKKLLKEGITGADLSHLVVEKVIETIYHKDLTSRDFGSGKPLSTPSGQLGDKGVTVHAPQTVHLPPQRPSMHPYTTAASAKTVTFCLDSVAAPKPVVHPSLATPNSRPLHKMPFTFGEIQETLIRKAVQDSYGLGSEKPLEKSPCATTHTAPSGQGHRARSRSYGDVPSGLGLYELSADKYQKVRQNVILGKNDASFKSGEKTEPNQEVVTGIGTSAHGLDSAAASEIEHDIAMGKNKKRKNKLENSENVLVAASLEKLKSESDIKIKTEDGPDSDDYFKTENLPQGGFAKKRRRIIQIQNEAMQKSLQLSMNQIKEEEIEVKVEEPSDVKVAEEGEIIDDTDDQSTRRVSKRSNRGQRYRELLSQGVLQPARRKHEPSEDSAAGVAQRGVKDSDSTHPPVVRRSRKRTVSESYADEKEAGKRYKTGDFDLDAHIASLPPVHIVGPPPRRPPCPRARKRYNSCSSATHHTPAGITLAPHKISYDIPVCSLNSKEPSRLNIAQLRQVTKATDINSQEQNLVGSQKRKARRSAITHLVQVSALTDVPKSIANKEKPPRATDTKEDRLALQSSVNNDCHSKESSSCTTPYSSPLTAFSSSSSFHQDPVVSSSSTHQVVSSSSSSSAQVETCVKLATLADLAMADRLSSTEPLAHSSEPIVVSCK